MASLQTIFEKLFRSNWIAYIGMSVALIAFVAGSFQFVSFSTQSQSSALRSSELAALFELQGKTERGLSAITQEQERIRNELKNLAKLSDQSKTSIELKHIEDSVTDVQNRESKLEDALLNNPRRRWNYLYSGKTWMVQRKRIKQT